MRATSGSINASEARFEISGSSQINLSGSAGNVNLTADGGAKIDLADFTADNAVVNLNDMCEATVNAKERLDVTLNNSELYFLGNPNMDNINTTGFSTLKHR